MFCFCDCAGNFTHRFNNVIERAGMFLAACAIIVSAGPGYSEGNSPESWTFQVSPYLWGAGLSGQVGTLPGLPPANVNSSFSDILSNLDFGGMVIANAHKGRFGVTADLQYIKLSSGSQSLQPSFASESIKARNTLISVMGEYKMSDSSTSELWFSAGARYWSVKTELDLAAGTLPSQSLSGKDSWVDPVIGLRGRWDISEKTYLTGWAYAGGFGVGSESMGDVFGGIGYRFSPLTSGVVGYRWLSVDRDTPGFLYDVTQKGLIAGLKFTF
jgi:hypothetical protein